MCNTDPVPTLSQLECIVGAGISSLLFIGGIILFVMLLVGGFQYMTSGGNLENVAKAHKTISFAIGGLIVALLSITLMVVIENLTGASITNFKVFK